MKNEALKSYFPACFVEFPLETEGRSAAFYLAAEEYIGQHFPFEAHTAYLFTWQLHPTVVMGRNQVAHQEVDLDFCQREGIEIIRRKSGGGAIFADERNIMTSLVTGGGPVEPLFHAYAHAVSAALNRLGATTLVSGRNDILLQYEDAGEVVQGKICGNAFYHQADRNIVHGTMLYDTNPRLMQGALHPDLCKLQASGVKSVRSRVALLKDVLNCGVTTLRQELRHLLTDRCVKLSDHDIRAIEEIERDYHTPEFLYGRKSEMNTILRRRIEGVGTIEMALALRNGRVEQLTLTGDYFELGPAETAFCEAFVGHAFTPAGIQERILLIHPERTIRHLTAEALLEMLQGHS